MNDHQDDIDRYLNGAMEGKDKASFLLRLEEDPALRQEFAEREKLAELIGIAALQEALQSIHQEMEAGETGAVENTPVKRISGRWWLAAAALLLLVMGRYFFIRYSNPPEAKLFAAWYEAPPGLPTLMGPGQGDDGLMEAMVDYKTKEYLSAVGKFNALLPDPSILSSPGTKALTPTDSVALFYLAASYMGAGQYDRAYLYFRRLAGAQPFGLPDHYAWTAQWYEALSCVRLKKFAEAKSILQDISGVAAHPFREKALKLSGELSFL